jgi:hypothetical protein
LSEGNGLVGRITNDRFTVSLLSDCRHAVREIFLSFLKALMQEVAQEGDSLNKETHRTMGIHRPLISSRDGLNDKENRSLVGEE